MEDEAAENFLILIFWMIVAPIAFVIGLGYLLHLSGKALRLMDDGEQEQELPGIEWRVEDE